MRPTAQKDSVQVASGRFLLRETGNERDGADTRRQTQTNFLPEPTIAGGQFGPMKERIQQCPGQTPLSGTE